MSHNLDQLFNHAPSPLELLQGPEVVAAGVQLFVKRDDLLGIGPGMALCGNKWRKLKYNLQAAKAQGYKTLLTFGGAYSNHIAAVAAAGQAFDFETIACIRGDQLTQLNPTLAFAVDCGMQLHYVNRSDYRLKATEVFQQQLSQQFGDCYLIPEGGTNDLALKGCRELISEIETQLERSPDYYGVSVGTGGTIAGMVEATQQKQKVLGFAALKGNFLEREVQELVEPVGKLKIVSDYHFGGYAKHKMELISFINAFKKDTGIPLDPIYTGKMFYGLLDLLNKGYFKQGSIIVAIHSGGLQGIAGFNDRHGDLII